MIKLYCIRVGLDRHAGCAQTLGPGYGPTSEHASYSISQFSRLDKEFHQIGFGLGNLDLNNAGNSQGTIGSVNGTVTWSTDGIKQSILTQLGENKYTMELRAWCPASSYWDALFTLNEATKNALDRDGITGPMPAIKSW